MARITVEDCLEKMDNRFDLVLIAAHRARQLKMGSESVLEKDEDKPTVIALREIAGGLVNREVLGQPLTQPEAEDALDPADVHRQAAEMEPDSLIAENDDEELDALDEETAADASPEDAAAPFEDTVADPQANEERSPSAE